MLSVCRLSVICQINCVGGITYGPAHAQSLFLAVTKKIEREGELRERKGRQTQTITRNSAWPLSKD